MCYYHVLVSCIIMCYYYVLFFIWNFFICMTFQAWKYQLNYCILYQFIHAIWFVWWDVGCWECGTLGKWHIEDVGCWRCGYVGDLGCSGCSMLGMSDVGDVGCCRCGMFGMWDVWDKRCGIWGGCWDGGYWFTKCLQYYQSPEIFYLIQRDIRN